ncbi:syntaxin-5 [Rozella allomycis CSF55]|uniref:Syntaxin-5 n=1 Tax=Rozella allomycis (strain CSF55) TaxID=988480 RepID=A0A4P9YGD1_ROZAC|nr:syntaxin-5 [Rozella allomycis CSF55]
MKDRSSEFFAAIESQKQRISPNLSEPLNRNRHQASAFAQMAGQIGKEIAFVSTKLEKFAILVRNKSSFEDRSTEIQELTSTVKQDIARLNQQIAALQSYQKGQGKAPNDQYEQHHSSMVVSLQSKLASTSSTFTDILEQRTIVLMHIFVDIVNERAKGKTVTVYLTQRHVFSARRSQSEDLVIDMGEAASFQQTQLVQQARSNQYLEARSEAIQNIESTIAELGGIFQQLSRMVMEQGDTVQRIDADIENMQFNVQQGEQQLLRYLQNISSNRWLMFRIFAIIILFFVLFVSFS